jgi:hypothetical protein
MLRKGFIKSEAWRAVLVSGAKKPQGTVSLSLAEIFRPPILMT